MRKKLMLQTDRISGIGTIKGTTVSWISACRIPSELQSNSVARCGGDGNGLFAPCRCCSASYCLPIRDFFCSLVRFLRPSWFSQIHAIVSHLLAFFSYITGYLYLYVKFAIKKSNPNKLFSTFPAYALTKLTISCIILHNNLSDGVCLKFYILRKLY